MGDGAMVTLEVRGVLDPEPGPVEPACRLAPDRPATEPAASPAATMPAPSTISAWP